MRFRFSDTKLRRLYEDPDYTGPFSRELVETFRKRVQLIKAAKDERDLRAFKSLRYEKLKGKRRHQRSMRLDSQWRLILELAEDDDGRLVVIVSIDEYHR